MTDAYQPRYQWSQTQLDEHHVPTDLDWCGYDNGAYIGRIRKETAGPTKNKWQWAGSYPEWMKGPRHLPHSGFVDTARIATQKVEEFWDEGLRRAKENS